MLATAMRKVVLSSFLLSAFLLKSTVNAQTCLMLYQLADNNLEPYIRQDFVELASSPVAESGLLRTWVYYDALTGIALPNTVDTDGNPVGSFTGSRYLTYDPSLGQMRVVVEFPTEVNSDAQSSMQAFMEYAMADCLANGFTSLMTVFASHGGGFAGFGGDENYRDRRGLLQTNAGVASAIRGALDSTEGAPNKVDVVGFDACNMMAFGAADDFGTVANYLLASEAVEPGHGWAYSSLTTATSALELAKEIVTAFLTQTQGGNSHQAPKTLAVLNLEAYAIFLTSLEEFISHATTNLQAGDVSLHSFISRSRSSAVSYEGIMDSGGAEFATCMDFGSWFDFLYQFCNPSGEMGTSLQATRDAYTSMFEVAGTGPGTSQGTGMHVLWPNQAYYFAQKELFDNVLFINPNYVTAVAPSTRSFLEYFLNSRNSGAADTSVCGGQSAVSEIPGADPNTLIYSDAGTLNEQSGFFDVFAEIGPKVDQMVVEYAVELTTPLKARLAESGRYETADDGYLFLKGGNLLGAYEGSSFSASWDQNFYFLNISGIGLFEALYVADHGNGEKRVPVMYFPEARRAFVSQLLEPEDFLFLGVDYWLEQGAVYSYLTFSVNEAEGLINDNLALFINNNESYFEQPREAGGMIIPVIRVNGYVQGRNITALPGGFNQTVVDWNTEANYTIEIVSTAQVLTRTPTADGIVVGMAALDNGDPDRPPDIRRYDVYRPSRTSNATPGVELGSAAPIEPETSSATCTRGIYGAAELLLLLTSLGLVATFV